MKKEELSIELIQKMFNAYQAGDKNLDSFEDCIEKRTLLYTSSGSLNQDWNDFIKNYIPNNITKEEIDNFKSILLNSSDEEKIDIIKNILDTFEMTNELKDFLKEYETILLNIKNRDSKEKHIIDCYFNSDDIDVEDSGCAKIFTVADDLDTGMFVRICSWDENKRHEEFNRFVGRKIKITIETID